MEKPVMPNPETMTEAEFDKWLEDEIPEDTSTPEEKEAAWQKFVAIAKEKGIWRED